MRILFVPLPFPTHHFPAVGLAWAFRIAGHDVRVATGAEMSGAVDGSGLPVVHVRTRPELVAAPERNGAWLRGGDESDVGELMAALVAGPLDNYARIAAAMADDLVSFSRAWRPDLVISDPLAYAGPLAAHAAGAVPVRHLWGVDSPRWFRLPGSGFDRAEPVRGVPWDALPWPPRLLELFERHGVEPADDLATRTVDPCPPSLQVPGAPGTVRTRYTSYNGEEIVPDWLWEPPARPRVCVTWGLASTRTLGQQYFGVPRVLEAIEALGLDVEVVVAARGADAERVAGAPGVRVGSVPLNALLPTCSAVVHHGGSGTLFTAASCGVPQLILSMMHEHEAASSRFAAHGSAALLAGGSELGDVRDALGGVLHDHAVRSAARRLAAEMRAQPSPAEAVTSLLELR
ncbi:nucleotide disphospho-sugar-binding domain-containing protein [Saccharopolyspora sp. MS10]|uniref:nucleotide disphospho-sugar-binding domain-containing protein n=1 Tax=Saccharopolyspora sp. MS10 TaxID=3385973 RepID=UPI0039A03187